MNTKLPPVTGEAIARVTQRLGFEFRRQTGSHAIYVRPTDHARVVIPMSRGVAVKQRTARGMIRELRLSVEEFSRLLQE